MHGHTFENVFVPRSKFYESPFGRMFPHLPPHQVSRAELESLANDMTADQAGGADNPNIPAGYTYFGQFVDHDITFDPTSSLMRLNDPNLLRNFRTPRYDLDSLYGAGPVASPHLYDKERGHGFLLFDSLSREEPEHSPTFQEDDLPRNRQGIALIGDPRNDENIIVSQLHLAFIKFHNRVLAELPDPGSDVMAQQARFLHAQQLVRWHYQWVVIHDFLPRLIGENRVRDRFPENWHKDGYKATSEFRLRYYDWKYRPFMPVEFSVAAYRLGHSMVRPTYELNDALTGIAGAIPIFDPNGAANHLADLRGERPIPPKWTLQWDRFLTFPDRPTPQFSKALDTNLSAALANLPPQPNGISTNLAFLNLLRGLSMSLPSGQSVARAMGYTLIRKTKEDPLWWYILKEAASDQNGGTKLGSVGGAILADVFVGLLLGDRQSFVNNHPEWKPSLGLRQGQARDSYELSNIIEYAGMPISAANLSFS